MTLSCTYSPDDNKLRLYSTTRLDAETYERVKAKGFKWAPRQQLFVAPAWSPGREDLLLELCGEIGDEDSTLVDRAEERAERFEEYSDKRLADAERARDTVAAIADNIPLGQPILVGHHSERHARKDAERVQSGMRKAVKMWETSKYWTARAAGAIRHAKYKELPAVRHRRIKGLEADKRKYERAKSEAETWLKLWSKDGLTLEQAQAIANRCWLHLPRKEGDRPDFSGEPTAHGALTNSHPELYAPRTLAEVVDHAKRVYPATVARCDRWISHFDNRLAYEEAMLAEQIGAEPGTGNVMADRFPFQIGGKVMVGREREWLTIIRVNRTDGAVNSLTTKAPSAAAGWLKTWKYGVEEVKDYQPPSDAERDKAKAATALPPLCNYPGEGFREMTEAEWKARNKWSDFSYIGTVKATEAAGAHRRRQMPVPGKMWEKQPVYITDGKRVDPPAPKPKDAGDPAAFVREHVAPPMVGYAASRPKENEPGDESFRAMRDGLKSGVAVQVVTAPQLFPTPAELAERVVSLADIADGQRVLEPSAGTGNLVWAVARAHIADVVAVEINQQLARNLAAAFPDMETRADDFLQCNGDLGAFDRVVMNPPFANGSDIKHIEHALGFLKPGGRLVAICANGPRQNERLKPMATEWHDLPPGTFKEAGTNVATAIVVIDKAE